MERCRNPLHGGNLIPGLPLSYGANVELATSWVDALYALMYDSRRILRIPDEVVEETFGWLETAESVSEEDVRQAATE